MLLEKHPITDQRIIDCLKIDYGINATTLTILTLGADIDASVYKVYTDNDASFFVKLQRGHNHDISTAIQILLHDAGIQQIISPITTIHDQPTQHIDNFTLIVYPFIEGQNGFCRDLNSDQWFTFGKALRQVHEFHLPPFITNKIKQELYSSKWSDSVKSICTNLEIAPIDEISLNLLTFMKKHKTSIQQLIDRSEQLQQKIKKQSAAFVLCHSDIHAGNLLIDHNGALYMVDWDQPIMAPKERDLMFIGGGVANVWNNPLEQEFFYKGYGKTEINMTILTYYRHERILEDIAIYGQTLLLTNSGGKNRQEMYKHFTDMFEPRGVVDIAFKTDMN